MRNIVIFISLIILGFSASCTDDLLLEPQNSSTFYSYFKTEKDFEAVLSTLENQFIQRYIIREYPMLNGSLDDKNHPNSYARRNRVPTFYIPGLGKAQWDDYYDVLTWTYIITDNLHRAESVSQEKKDYFEGQALFMRSFIYFRLAQEWGNVPVVYSQEGTDAKQLPWKEVVKIAINYCKKSAKLLKPWSELTRYDGKSVQSKQIAGKGTAYALLAHEYAWIAGFGKETAYNDSTVMAASYVIDGHENYAPEYTLEDDPELICTKTFLGQGNELIFCGDITFEELGQNNNAHSMYLCDKYQSWPRRFGKKKRHVTRLSTGLKNTTVRKMYGDTDKRRQSFFYKFEELEKDDDLEGYALIDKRRECVVDDSDPDWPSFVNWKGVKPIFRLADIILLRAEAYAKMGQDGKAIIDLNNVRARSEAKPYTASEGDLYEIIFLEREKELLLEGYRWFDCLRTGFWKKHLPEGVRALTDQDVEDGALFWPVANSALGNPDIRQNKYWLGKW